MDVDGYDYSTVHTAVYMYVGPTYTCQYFFCIYTKVKSIWFGFHLIRLLQCMLV